jgi:hypothetical protein
MTMEPGRVLLALCAIALVGASVAVLPSWLAPAPPTTTLERLSEAERLEATNAQLKLQNDIRTTALQAIAGLAILASAVLAFQQLTEDRQQAAQNLELVRQGQASERFTRAISQLGSDRREVQLGGIYGLEQIAEQAPDNRLVVTEVLVAYLHRRAPRPPKPTDGPSEELRVRAPDVHAALTVLARHEISYPGSDPSLDLRGLDLRGATLNVARVGLADFRGSDLRDARFFEVDLVGADLSGADLRGAYLWRTNLRQSHLNGADLRGADLSKAHLGALDDGVSANLGGAIADQHTSWPPNFDPQGAGIRMTS